ncbi:MAG: alpha/beta hydrolase [Sphaerochaetaceae bacterium]|nr:alpha/beta hydrolase [Sphaerochaetaceae bacterium]
MEKMEIIIAIVLFLVLIILIGSYVTYVIAFKRSEKREMSLSDFPFNKSTEKYREKTLKMVAEFASLPYEKVGITSKDGTKLFGRYYNYNEKAPVVIMIHGYRSSGYHDFCGGSVIFRNNGFNLLCISQRGHGESGGRAITFGIKEKYDVLSWIYYLIARLGNDVPIALCGTSMGAATVLMVSGLNLPKNVKAIMADAPYSSVKEILSLALKKFKLPQFPFMAFMTIGARIFGGFSIKDGEVASYVENSKVPLLIVHGDADHTVPYSMSQFLKEAYPEKIDFEVFPEAAHCLSYMVDEKRYTLLCDTFIDKYFLSTK